MHSRKSSIAMATTLTFAAIFGLNCTAKEHLIHEGRYPTGLGVLHITIHYDDETEEIVKRGNWNELRSTKRVRATTRDDVFIYTDKEKFSVADLKAAIVEQGFGINIKEKKIAGYMVRVGIPDGVKRDGLSVKPRHRWLVWKKNWPIAKAIEDGNEVALQTRLGIFLNVAASRGNVAAKIGPNKNKVEVDEQLKIVRKRGGGQLRSGDTIALRVVPEQGEPAFPIKVKVNGNVHAHTSQLNDRCWIKIHKLGAKQGESIRHGDRICLTFGNVMINCQAASGDVKLKVGGKATIAEEDEIFTLHNLNR